MADSVTTDFRIPFQNDTDTLVTQLCVKNVMERGAYYRCDRIAAPYGMDLRDFPMAENLHFGAMKLLALGTKNPYRVINYYYILTFALTTLTAVFTFRQFGVAPLAALVAALLFVFLPYHLLRGEGHLFLSAYYMIPPIVLVILGPPGKAGSAYGDRFRAENDLLGTLGQCRGGLSTGLRRRSLFCFFGCFFLFVVGVVTSLWRRRWTPLFQSAVLIAVICGGILLCLRPCLLYQREGGLIRGGSSTQMGVRVRRHEADPSASPRT